MPELPEVETIAGILRSGTDAQPAIVGMEIAGARLLWERTLAAPGPDEFQARIAGQRIRAIGRRGKYLLASLTDDTLLVHLRMSGDLLVEPISAPLAPHHRMVVDFKSEWRLAFNDTRKFGRVWLVEDPAQVLDDLGPEPLDESLTADLFYERLKARHRQLKPLLMDQSFVAGMGNIYTDEALHLARLNPLALSDSLSAEQAEKLLFSMREVLREGIRRNGASIDWVYRGGDFQNYFRVYQRTGQACLVCGTPVERIVVGQRSTHFCPVCQPIRPDR